MSPEESGRPQQQVCIALLPGPLRRRRRPAGSNLPHIRLFYLAPFLDRTAAFRFALLLFFLLLPSSLLSSFLFLSTFSSHLSSPLLLRLPRSNCASLADSPRPCRAEASLGVRKIASSEVYRARLALLHTMEAERRVPRASCGGAGVCGYGAPLFVGTVIHHYQLICSERAIVPDESGPFENDKCITAARTTRPCAGPPNGTAFVETTIKYNSDDYHSLVLFKLAPLVICTAFMLKRSTIRKITSKE
ncbi:hypothetical protein DFH07DRAFT_973574 [Mycena maculata]|uniref:Uncharacterized protein n=1 Tax=Mycena maculata TaxID=230809 RepID=A0AAD7HD50_9AGAR|nr:hypothetical protein DFH07DRAFT_973574 [Mycena maculata]